VLTAAAVIEAEPLSVVQAAEYLQACLPPDPGPTWRDVLHRIQAGTAEHLARVVATPLGLWLLRTIYIAPRTDPRPLLSCQVTHDATALQAHLLDQLIPTVLATHPASSNPYDQCRPRRSWDPAKVRNWLTYLAEHLHRTQTRDLLWWHLARHTFSRREFGLVVGLLVVLISAAGLELAYGWGVGPRIGLQAGLVTGPITGLVTGLVIGLRRHNWLTDDPAYANLRLKQRTGMLVRDLGVGTQLTRQPQVTDGSGGACVLLAHPRRRLSCTNTRIGERACSSSCGSLHVGRQSGTIFWYDGVMME
jgi:hypothetical protein